MDVFSIRSPVPSVDLVHFGWIQSSSHGIKYLRPNYSHESGLDLYVQHFITDDLDVDNWFKGDLLKRFNKVVYYTETPKAQ